MPVLSWDANPEAEVRGYRVYRGQQSRSYTSFTDVGLTTAWPMTNLSAGITHYFSVIAYDSNNVEGPWSDEVIYTPRINGVSSTVAPLRLTRVNGGYRIEFNARTGQQCQIAYSSDLITWHLLFSITATTSSPVSYFDPAPLGENRRFYRVIVTPP